MLRGTTVIYDFNPDILSQIQAAQRRDREEQSRYNSLITLGALQANHSGDSGTRSHRSSAGPPTSTRGSGNTATFSSPSAVSWSEYLFTTPAAAIESPAIHEPRSQSRRLSILHAPTPRSTSTPPSASSRNHSHKLLHRILPLGRSHSRGSIHASEGQHYFPIDEETGEYILPPELDARPPLPLSWSRGTLGPGASTDTLHDPSVPPPVIASDESHPPEAIIDAAMSRHDRPLHIALPANGASYSPPRSPVSTPPGQQTGALATSPASPRHSFLGFMRTRGRSVTMEQRAAAVPSNGNSQTTTSASLDAAARGAGAREQSAPGRAEASTGGAVTRTVSTTLSGTSASNTARPAAAPTTSTSDPSSSSAPSNPFNNASSSSNSSPAPASTDPGSNARPDIKTFRIRLVPHLESRRSLPFDPVIREMYPVAVTGHPGTTPIEAGSRVADSGSMSTTGGAARATVRGKPVALVLKIGRFTDRGDRLPVPQPASSAGANGGWGGSGGIGGEGALNPDIPHSAPANLSIAGGGGEMTSGKAAFRSKVVSRSHAEIWCEEGGKFWIRDTKSSSGTFLNHIRLSSPNVESRPMMIKDGDILQLGVDFQGGTEEMFKCVKMRVEIGREWQRGANEFNTNALKQIKALGGGDSAVPETPKGAATPGKKQKASVTDCCICLYSVTVCQSLFIAPCSHVFHYKCIRPLLMQHYPAFSCPLCRTFANLEEDVETEDAWEIASRRASVISRRPSNHSIIPSAAAAVNAAPPIPAGPPTENGTSTGVVTGSQSSAAVNELLPPTGNETLSPVATLTRQDTVVAETDPPLTNNPFEVGPAIATVPENEEMSITSTGPSTGPRPILQPIAAESASNANFSSEAATPMNDTFLSTLALAPGMLQRLELAEEMSSHGGTANGTAPASAAGSGESRTGSQDGSRRVSGASDGIRGDMYT
ncbi:hypothetical protein I350_01657 [Cryptococcus amylolentus CBS 6273]|uniref:RING-type domain-containing protein n=1 Tax=Cryptococcus amylolentus CBS 6273 TaxID=1296118 RepID=A0A1E3KDF2_9TREE|nr:hypothetical protein I350_01657 [Cryptococcus amylolentus CBS 6273]